jgi:hypothetical protein
MKSMEFTICRATISSSEVVMQKMRILKWRLSRSATLAVLAAARRLVDDVFG